MFSPLPISASAEAERRFALVPRNPVGQNDPNAEPSPITTASAMMAPTMPTITMSN
jgi:hypothetical protein